MDTEAVTIPNEPVPVPAVVTRIAAGRPVYPAWTNEAGGFAFQVGDGDGREFVKVQPPHPEVNLHREADKLRWVAPYLTVPAVLAVGRDGASEWLHTAGIPGRTAVIRASRLSRAWRCGRSPPGCARCTTGCPSTRVPTAGR